MTNATRIAYGITRDVDLGFAEAVAQAKRLLADQGFGVLCEIDVAATLRATVGAEIGDYVILGACKPDSAFKVLSADPNVGLLLPCNVVVRHAGGRTTVAAIDASAMLRVTGRDELEAVAADVDRRLTAVVEGVGA